MHKIYNIIVGQTNNQLQEKAELESTFQAVNIDRDPTVYLLILKKLWLSNQSIQHPIQFLCLETRQMHNTMNKFNKNTTNYLFRFYNYHKVNDAWNGSLISRGVQEHGMKIIYPLHVTSFNTLPDNHNKEAETAGE